MRPGYRAERFLLHAIRRVLAGMEGDGRQAAYDLHASDRIRREFARCGLEDNRADKAGERRLAKKRPSNGDPRPLSGYALRQKPLADFLSALARENFLKIVLALYRRMPDSLQ